MAESREAWWIYLMLMSSSCITWAWPAGTSSSWHKEHSGCKDPCQLSYTNQVIYALVSFHGWLHITGPCSQKGLHGAFDGPDPLSAAMDIWGESPIWRDWVQPNQPQPLGHRWLLGLVSRSVQLRAFTMMLPERDHGSSTCRVCTSTLNGSEL